MINGSVQFIGLSQIWGSSLPYIINIRAHVEATGWASISNGNPGSGTPGSSTVTGSWDGIFVHSTVNWSVNWYGSANASSTDSPQIPDSPRVAQHCVCKYFLHPNRQQRLWRQSNCWVHRQRQDRDFYDGLATKYFLVQNSVASVSNCVWIANKIALFVTRGHFL